jgi:prepilin-type N-terminal cleavage/methylation domain-containing protein
MTKNKNQNKKKGFTLVEIMVAISIFAIIALIVVQAFITADRVNKKAQAMKTVIDNLHFALNSISFNLQQGGTYHCLMSLPTGNPASYTYDVGADCGFIEGGGGGPAIAFKSPKSGTTHSIIYKFQSEKIWYWESDSSMNDFVPITIDNLVIENLRFYVLNYDTGSTAIPRVFFTIAGKAVLGQGMETKFQLQTVVSERI